MALGSARPDKSLEPQFDAKRTAARRDRQYLASPVLSLGSHRSSADGISALSETARFISPFPRRRIGRRRTALSPLLGLCAVVGAFLGMGAPARADSLVFTRPDGNIRLAMSSPGEY
jgi:hypothetical protein